MISAGALRRLLAEVRSDRAACVGLLDELAGIPLAAQPSPPRSLVAQAAVALHHAYGAVESILVRCSRVLEGDLPRGADWHKELLEAMGLEIPGARAAILSPDTLTELRHLLAFRHFFRHAYSVVLDAARLVVLQGNAARLRPCLDRDLDRLERLIGELANLASGSSPP